jgi:hypothetical protein
LNAIISNNTFKVTICDLKNKDRNMADITEKTGNGELVTNCDQLVVVDNIESLIKVIRGQQVMLDKDLATPYGVETRTLNQAVKRNIQRFPSDFRFQLAMEEYSKVDSIRNMLQRIKCNTIRTVDYKYFDIEIYDSSNLSYSYLHLKDSIEYHNIITISNNSKYGNLFSISL